MSQTNPRRPSSNIRLAIITILLLIAGAFWITQNTPQAIELTIAAPQFANPHLQNPTDPHPTYTSNPPTSGMHWGGGVAPWGIASQPIPDEITVHNLEHGGIIIHYRDDIDDATIEKIVTLARQLQTQNGCLIVEPRPRASIDAPIIVTSWEHMLKLQTFNAERIRTFFLERVNHGPEKICISSS